MTLDQSLFNRFKPNKLIVRKMRLDNIIQNGDFDESQKALDFCAFLLRYNREIDYSFFSDVPEIQEMI